MSNSEVLFNQKTRIIELALDKFLKKKEKALKLAYKVWLKSCFYMVNGTFGLGIKSPLANVGTVLKQVQILGLSFSGGAKGGFLQFLNVFLVYEFEFYKGFPEHFTVFCASLCLFLIFCLILLLFQVLIKKNVMRMTLVLVINSLTFIINNFLVIPMYLSAFQYIGGSNNSQIFGKGVYLLTSIYPSFLVLHLLVMNSIAYESRHDSTHHKSRSYSLTIIIQDIGVCVLCFIYINFSRTYFLFTSLLMELLLMKNLILYSGFFKKYQILIESGVWMTASTSTSIQLLNHIFTLNIDSIITLILLIPLEYILINHYLQKQYEACPINTFTDPYAFDLQLRKLLNSQKPVNEETLQLADKMFNKATIEFFEFKPLYIWEFNYIVQYKQDFSLALLKISKMLFSDKKPKYITKPLRVFSYLTTFECDFLFYSYTKKMKKIETNVNSETIKYKEKIVNYKNLDYRTCCKLISLVNSICLSESTPISKTLKIFKSFHELSEKRKEFYEKFTKNYGYDRKFIELFDGFKREVFRTYEKHQNLKLSSVKFNYLDKFSAGIDFCSQIVIDGSPDKVSQILYVNEGFRMLLKYPNENIFIGLKLGKLIPKSFWKPSETLVKFLLFSNSNEFFKSRMFLFNFFGYLIEVSANFQAVYVNGSCRFIVNMAESDCKGFILVDTHGKIISKSELFQSIMPNSFWYIEEYFEGIQKILEVQAQNEEFSYDTTKFLYHLSWEQLQGTKNPIKLIYIRKENKLLTISSLINGQSIQAERRKSLFFGEAFFEEKGDIEKSIIIQKREEKKQKKQFGSDQIAFTDHLDAINKYAKVIKLGIFFSVLFQVLIYLAIILYFSNFYDDSKHFNALKDICDFRYEFYAVLMNLRSIDLVSKGVVMNYGFRDYNATLYEKLYNSEAMLHSIQSYGDEFGFNKYFTEYQVQTYSYFNNSFEPSQEQLYNSVFRLLETVRNVAVRNYSSTNLIQGIYKNGFYSLSQHLSESFLKLFIEIKKSANSIIGPFDILNIISLFPMFIIGLISTVIFFKLHQINTSLWNEIKQKPVYIYSVLEKTLIERIKKLHNPRYIHESYQEEKINLKSSISKLYICKFFVYCLAVILYFLLFHYIFEKNINNYAQLKLDFRYYAGSRTSTIRPYVWAREAQLRKINEGYLNFNTHYVEINSEKLQAKSSLSKLRASLQYSLHLAEKMHNEYNNHDYLLFMSNSSCPFIPEYEWCRNSSLSYGIYIGMNAYINDLSNFINNDNENFDSLAKIELKKKHFELAYEDVYSLLTKNIIDANKYLVICIEITIGMIFLIIIIARKK